MHVLKGKTALITGSDSGIGHAIAIAFAKEGANIVVCYHSNKQKAEETAAEIKSAGQHVLTVQVDVSSENDVKQLFERAIGAFKKIDILVNSAAVNTAHINLEDMPTAVFDRTMRTNLYSVFFCCREFLNLLKEEKVSNARIINISSIHEDVVAPGGAGYNASKGAIKNLTRTLALEVANRGITVNNIAPGMILTPMNQQAIDNKSVRDEASSHIPLHRPGNAEEVARVAVFLASPQSGYITGSTYFIDGGLSINLGQGA
ncbi:SDR family oxidoreductase [Pedobacter sp. BS3]|uniref:SDR family NAD(P)-dependent oxidoreductase n=1 Tax=Pedobacter sp. BS3 TaxID=2567937 RepID=UPI0011EBA51F|nr:SDR family oxidoreductase [Pedobacter sp. BS3]TZF82038.1 SDR family oxidoreductase [Pedobacter sp. BS3]